MEENALWIKERGKLVSAPNEQYIGGITGSNLSSIYMELLAIIYALKHFRPYVYGRFFLIYTDHRPLVYLVNLKNPSSRLMRWKLELSEYDFNIIHKPGRLNSNADALSRIEITPDEILGIEPIKNKLEEKYPQDIIDKCVKLIRSENELNVLTRSQVNKNRKEEQILPTINEEEENEDKENETEKESENILNENRNVENKEKDKETIGSVNIREEQYEKLVKKDFDKIIFVISHPNDERNKVLQIGDIYEKEIGKLEKYKRNEMIVYLPENCGKETDLDHILKMKSRS